MKNKLFTLMLASTFMLLQYACRDKAATDLTRVEFIPAPVSVIATGGSFIIDDSMVIYFEEGEENLDKSADYLARELQQITGHNFQVREINELPKEGIYLTLTDDDQTLGDEGYILEIGLQLISINANGLAGSFYGIQTLLQTMPVQIEAICHWKFRQVLSVIFRNMNTGVRCLM